MTVNTLTSQPNEPSINNINLTKQINSLRINKLMQSSKVTKENPQVFVLPSLDKETKRLYLGASLSIDARNSPESYMCALYDSGSDVNILSEIHFKRLFPNLHLKSLLEPTDLHVTGYTGATVKILGTVNAFLRVNKHAEKVPFEFAISNADASYPAIVNLETLMQLELDTLNLYDDNQVLRPFLICKDSNVAIESYYLSDFDFCTVEAKFYMEPLSTKMVKVKLPKHANIVPGEKVLISDDFLDLEHPDLEIHPTSSECLLNFLDGSLECHVRISNLSDTSKRANIVLYFENINNCTIKAIDVKNISCLRRPLLTEVRRHNIEMPNDKDNCFLFEEKLEMIDNSRSISFPHSLDIGINHIKTLPKSLYLVDTRFPAHSDFVAGDPNCINNNSPDPKVALTDLRNPLNAPLDSCDESLEKEFRDPATSVQVGIREIKEEEFDKILADTGGYEIPKNLNVEAKDLVDLEAYDEEMRPYIEDIFIRKYPNLVSLHSLDLGNLSKTLGEYKLKLKRFAVLPEFKKIYYLNPSELSQLQCILQFLIKYDAISKVSTTGTNKDLNIDSFCSPSYLIPRSNPNSSARLIVNYKFLNENLACESTHLDTASSVINSFRDSYLFSNLDLSCAFQSIRISPESRDLTLFSTPLGSYKSHILPTGVKASPNVLASIMHKCIHYVWDYDAEGKVKLGEDGLPEMKWDPIPQAKNIYDDLIIGTELKDTYANTLKHHFEILEEVMRRLSFHRGKLSFPKCNFAKTKINFFGFFISSNFCAVDPKRVIAILQKPFPENIKDARSIHGLVTTIRLQLGHLMCLDLQWLSDLLKTKKAFTPTQAHREQFDDFKKQLKASSLYANIICPSADKILFTDSAVGSTNCFSAVLGQIIKPNNEDGKIYPPLAINLEDRNHRVIYDNQMGITPLPLVKKDQSLKDYRLTVREVRPPDFDYLDDDFYGWDESEAHNSLAISLKHMYDFLDNVLPFEEVCLKMTKEIRQNVAKYRYLDLFGKSLKRFDEFIRGLKRGLLPIDQELLIFDALSKGLQRPIKVVSAYFNHMLNVPVRDFGQEKTGQPLIFLLYLCKRKPNQVADADKNLPMKGALVAAQHEPFFVVRPAYIRQFESFPYKRYRGTFEIVSYLSKNIPAKHDQSHIIEMELAGILIALFTYRKLIGNANLLLLTDNKCLYYLFHESMLESSVKIHRWHRKVIDDYPQLVFGFVKSGDNIADFLTRNYHIEKPVMRRLQLPRFVNAEKLERGISQDKYSIQEWREFVAKNPDILETIQPLEERIENLYKINVLPSKRLSALKATVNLNTLQGRLKYTNKNYLTPIECLREILTLENIVEAQKEEYAELYQKCMSVNSYNKDGHTYFLQDNLLFVERSLLPKICIPSSLLNKLVALGHLLTNHSGFEKMMKNLANFHHPKLRQRVKTLATTCFACALCNYPTRRQKMCYYNTDDEVMQTLSMDLMESLPTNNGYKNLIVMSDPISSYTFVNALKNKTSQEFLQIFFYQIYPNWGVSKILCDSGSLFMAQKSLEALFVAGVHVIYSASHHSPGHGFAEANIKLLKVALKKTLVAEHEFNWLYAAPALIKEHNLTVNVKLGFSPAEIVFGKSNPITTSHFAHLTNLTSEKTIPKLRGRKARLEVMQKEKQDFVQKVKENIEIERTQRIEKENLTRKDYKLNENDLVLVKNHTHITGRPKAFVPFYQLSPYKIMSVSESTVVVRRITDSLIRELEEDELGILPKRIKEILDTEFRYPKDQVKVLKMLPETFKDLPTRVLKILVKSYDKLDSADIRYLVQKDDYDLPDPSPNEEELNGAVGRTNDIPQTGGKSDEGSEEPQPGPSRTTQKGADANLDANLVNDAIVNEENVSSDEDDITPQNEVITPRYGLRQNPPKKVMFDPSTFSN